jgi:hypothetical protein
MKLLEVKSKIYESFINFESEYGYKANKTKFGFIKKDKDFISGLYFTENHWFDEVQIMPSVFVDVEEINLIWRQFNKNISYTYFMNLLELKDWYELKCVSWDKFKRDDGNKYKLFNVDEDLSNALHNIKDLFENYGLRYVKDFSTVEGVDKLYNTNLLDINSPHCSGFQVQSIVGMIAAKLSGNADYKNITDVYSVIIEKHRLNDSMNLDDIDMFYKVREYLG